MKSVFQGIRNAQVFDRGNFLKAGSYVLEIQRCLVKEETQKSGPCYIVEFNVLESNNPDHKVGSKVTWIQKLQNKSIAHGALKEFIYAVTGYRWPEDKAVIVEKIDPVLEDLIESTLPTEDGGKNSFATRRVAVETFMKKTQNQKDFTVHKWSPAVAKAA